MITWTIGRRIGAVASVLSIIIVILVASAATTQSRGRQAVIDALAGVASGQKVDAVRDRLVDVMTEVNGSLHRGTPEALGAIRKNLGEIEQLLSDLPKEVADRAAVYRKSIEASLERSAKIVALEADWEPLTETLSPPLDRLLKSRAESADADGAIEVAQTLSLVGEGRRLAAIYLRDANMAGDDGLPALAAQSEALIKKWAEVAAKVTRLQRNYGSGTGAAAMRELAPAVERTVALIGELAPAKLARAELRAREIEQNSASLEGAIVEVARSSVAEVERTAGRLPEDLAIGTWVILGVGAVGLLIGAGMIMLLTRTIAPPIRELTGAMTALAGKQMSVEVPGVDRKDELGEMAQAVLVFKDSLIDAERLEAEQKERAEAARAQFMSQAITYFTDETGDVVQAVSSAAGLVHEQASVVSAAVGQTNAQAAAVANASDQATQNVEIVAAAAQELSASISEIAQQVGRSMSVADRAVTEAQRTSETIEALRDAVGKISAVVGLINQIASQTNLLALNATIEAARAGEAGKGFSVVASEVKQLAQQTARATEEIQAQVQAVQTQTSGAVEAIMGIGGTIRDLNALAAAVAAAVEEQGAATKEIAQNVEQAALGMATVSDTIQQVVRLAQSTGGSASAMLSSAEGLGVQSGRLSQSIDSFVGRLKRQA